ncbi:hypothetical protein JG687_00009916 [Phytophthora cactorum]|nr:hypothetical protein Pcac1_g19900 [Phytophthora cactorum]KAG2807785.1 hypothetical protein PC112_g17258 [Phytophthora cactorum]KAG2887657.1 hypothetical protein PC114_g18740 [Phytophthora cactorum]KAG2914695.1 hypothetical protein PC117_g18246 [Phytophthora cactorum]KAG3006011.1 hypothetical protein PC120_g17650 [Phytophthora cactorum]
MTEAALKSIYFATKAPVSLCSEIAFEQQQEETFPTAESPELPQQEETQISPEPQEADENQTEDNKKSSKAELHPETPDEVPKIKQAETSTVQSIPTTTSLDRKSTPRRRLSVAVQLDTGLNKNRELPVKRPTVITRVAVQPKQKADVDPPSVRVNEPVDTPVQQQQHEQVAPKPVKGARQRLLSRPKEKLFDAIRRSFSRSKKAPLGST